MPDSARNIAINIRTAPRVMASDTVSDATTSSGDLSGEKEDVLLPGESDMITLEQQDIAPLDIPQVSGPEVGNAPVLRRPILATKNGRKVVTDIHPEIISSQVCISSEPAARTLAPRRADSFEELHPPRPTATLPLQPVLCDPISGADDFRVAYLCMEVGLQNEMPTYAGGLGILAGDMLKSAADLKLPMIGVTLIHRKGFFKQHLDEGGWQQEEEIPWDPSRFMELLPHRVVVVLEGVPVTVRAWRYRVVGVSGHEIPVVFLDTDDPANTGEFRYITDRLYDSDTRWRFLQESVLGIGGVRMLAALGVNGLTTCHMNEGHAALMTLELYRSAKEEGIEDAEEYVRSRCVFTTHTPVAAGHDHFPKDLVARVLGDAYLMPELSSELYSDEGLSMTRLGFHFSRHINGVAKKHGEVARELFPGYRVEFITNGVHAREWVAPPLARLYDAYLPGWQSDPHSLRYVLSIPLSELWSAHQEAKRALCSFVNTKYGTHFDEDRFTIGFARRAASYKRAAMLFSDLERLSAIARGSRGIQILFAGKAHPSDEEGKKVIQRVVAEMRKLGGEIECIYLEDYDMDMGKLLVSGVDLWLNTPTRPQEASGTSGMKAALNGVPQFSVLDGWWLEGHIEGVTGWSIGPHPEKDTRTIDAEDAEDMYRKLEHVIIPCFERSPEEWQKVMRQAIAINGSFFNSHRMVEQYVIGSYFI